MSNTPNYNLYLTEDDDSSTKFKEWRKNINGSTDSNMTKIDTALGEKANSSKSVTTTLPYTSWVGTEAPYTQTITVTGLTANQNGTISIAQTATAEQRAAARDAMLTVTGQAANSLTITADGEMPVEDIPVCIILMG